MIHSIKQTLTLSVPLTLTSHHQAQLFYQRYTDSHKAKQVYLNTLAVEAVKTYLGWLGIDSDLQSSDCWNPVIQTLADIADLTIPGQGKLECRPVLPGAKTCHIPPETNADRLGYLPVLFDTDLETATLLGFVPGADVSVETEEILLSQLQPVTALLDVLKPAASLMGNASLIDSTRVRDEPTRLGRWLKGTIASGWQSIETLLVPQPVFKFRSLELVESAAMTGAVVRGKLLALKGRQVTLVVGIAQGDALQSDVWVKLCPSGGDRYLPEALEIKILDDQGIVVMKAQARQTDMLQLNFRGMLNEQFAVEVGLSDASVVERFAI